MTINNHRNIEVLIRIRRTRQKHNNLKLKQSKASNLSSISIFSTLRGIRGNHCTYNSQMLSLLVYFHLCQHYLMLY